jgi:hypothetical protein
MTSDVPIRLQIVNRGNWETYKMMQNAKKSNIIILGIKTDCITCTHDAEKAKVKTVKNAKFGEYRDEKKCKFTITQFKEKCQKFKENEPHRKGRPNFEYIVPTYEWIATVADENE